jgi:hypothetical protein
MCSSQKIQDGRRRHLEFRVMYCYSNFILYSHKSLALVATCNATKKNLNIGSKNCKSKMAAAAILEFQFQHCVISYYIYGSKTANINEKKLQSSLK